MLLLAPILTALTLFSRVNIRTFFREQLFREYGIPPVPLPTIPHMLNDSLYVKHGIEHAEAPLCIHCVHFDTSVSNGRADLGRCSLYGTRNLITGIITYTYAELVRQNDSQCRPSGVNFVQQNESYTSI